MNVTRRWLVGLSLLLAAPACGGDAPDGEAALEEALARSAGDPRGRFAPSPLPLADAAPHRLEVSATFTLDGVEAGVDAAGEPVRRGLVITRTIERGAGGRYRVRDERRLDAPDLPEDGAVEGREAVFDGEALASRRLHGPWMRRDTLDGSQDRLIREAYALGPAALRAFGPYIAWSAAPRGGEARLVGAPVRWERASRASDVAPAPLDDAALKALRDHTAHWTAWLAATHPPTRVSGTVARHAETDELVAGELEIAGAATVEGATGRFELRLSYAISPLPEGRTFEVPDDSLPTLRARPWRMIEAVLGEDLAPEYSGRGPAKVLPTP